MARPRTVPNPENASIHELKEASRVGTFETATRCTAIQMLVTGITREQVCKSLEVSMRALQKWILLFNQSGIDGLIAKKRTGRSRKITPEKTSDLIHVFESPEQAERTFWTVRAFHGYIQKEFQIDCSYQTVLRFVHEQNFALKVPQPWPNRQDENQRQAFREQLKTLSALPDVELWFSDESGFEGECKSRRRWDRVGAKTRVVRNGDHIRMNVMGLVCPRTGEFFSLEVSHVDTDVFQVFLNEAARTVQPSRKRNILILDNASWHRNSRLKWRCFEPLFLPPYSPDFNPIERLWLTIKSKWFNHYHAPTYEALIHRLDQALLDVINNPVTTQNTTSMRTLF